MATAVTAVLLGLLIGAVLGGLGGGGSVLTVPALVYGLGAVGVTALAGTGSYVAASQVRWATGLTLALVGVPATYAGSLLNGLVDGNVLLLAFAALMMMVAALMVRDSATPTSSEGAVSDDAAACDDCAAAGVPRWGVVATATGIGLLTGFFGVGGGFAIVPALVLVLRLPMAEAVGTSLLVIALNSGVALASRATSGGPELDWPVVLPFTAAAVVATVVGKRVADRVPARRLQGGFALLLVLVALYQAVQSILALG